MEEAEITALVEPLRVHERRVQSEESVQRRLRARRHLDPRAARVVERIARRQEGRHADGGRAEELSAREGHRPSLSAQWVRNSGLESRTVAACCTRFAATGSGSTSRNPMAA